MISHFNLASIFLGAATLCSITVSSHGGLILGLDAHDISQGDGSSVSNWSSGIGAASQGNAALQPTYRASSPNLGGGPAVDFDDQPSGALAISDGDGMTTTVSGLGADYTILTLYAYRGTNADAARVVQGGNGTRNAGGAAGTNNWLIGPYNGQHQLYDGAFIPSGSSSTSPVIATALGSSAANEEFFLNGILQGTNSGANTPNFVGLGTEGAWAEAADSDVGLVLVFDNTLTPDERVGVEYYMAQSYGLQGFSATSSQQAAGAAALGGFLVPEPSSALLLLLGGMGCLLRRRR